MTNNDKNTREFIIKLTQLRDKSNDFSKIDYRALLEDPTYLLIFRTVAGMTTNLFSKNIDMPYSWIYNLEHAKRKLGVKGAKNIANRVSILFKKNKFSSDVEDVKRNFNSLNSITIVSSIEELNNLHNKSYEEFITLFDKLKELTANFTHLSNVILEDSKVILVFRLMLGISQKQFANKLNISNHTIEELENGYRKIRYPRTAKEYGTRIRKLISTKRIDSTKLEKNWFSWKNTRKIRENKGYNWKTIRYTTTKDFEKYLVQIRRETNNFSYIPSDLFQKNPQVIMIFRIMLGLTQRELERKLKFKGRYISNYERLKYKTISKGRAELLSEYFKSQIKSRKLDQLTDKQIINNFLEIKDLMFTHRNTTIGPIEKFTLTNQEKKILKILKTIKKLTLKILPHYNMNTKKGIINFDFLITFKNKPKIAIECTTSESISKKFGYNLKRKIYELDYRFTKLKKSYPKIKTILIMSIFDDDLNKYRIMNIIKEETLSINNSFINSESILLPKMIMEELKINE